MLKHVLAMLGCPFHSRAGKNLHVNRVLVYAADNPISVSEISMYVQCFVPSSYGV